MSELLPCPFCGGEADEYEGDYGNGIYCMMCGAMVGEPIHLGYRTMERVSIDEAIAAWNTRADYRGYEQAAIEAWESIKAWNTRAERTCHRVDVDGYSFRFECSACGYVSIVHNCETRLDELPNYCPNCGAKVIEEEE